MDGTKEEEDILPLECSDEMGRGQRINHYNSLTKEEKAAYLKEYEKHKIESLKRFIQNHEETEAREN